MGGFQAGKGAKTKAVTGALLAASRRIAYLEAPSAIVFVADAEKQELQKRDLTCQTTGKAMIRSYSECSGRRLFSTSKSHVRRLQP